MKRIVLFLMAMGVWSVCHAAPPVAEAPINGYGTPTTVSISTDTSFVAAWTKIPTSQTSGRMGIFVSVPAANTGALVGHLGNCTSTVIATSVRPIQIIKGTNNEYISMREDVCLWAITTHSSAESVHYQEVKQ